jgi:hypothetical protein
MIKFFRKIRYDLMETGKTIKYFKYAIGEIILVMVGILLALQVSNWNQTRKATAKEIKILTELKNDLVANLAEVKEVHKFTDIRQRSTALILDYFKTKKVLDDSLKLAFEKIQLDGVFNNASTTYKFIENQGVDIISNDSLRIRITEMHERQFNNITTRETIDLSIVDNQLHPSMNEHFKTSPPIDTLIPFALAINTPKNIEVLRINNTFKNVVVRLQNFLLVRLNWQKETIIDLEELIIDLQKEIDTLNS